MNTFRRLLGWALYGGALLYSAAMLALALLWSFTPEATWWVALSNVFAPFFFAPTLALLLLALLMRSPHLAAIAAAPAFTFAVLFGGLFVPRPAPALPPGDDLRVATVNQLYYGQNHAPLLAAISAQQADIVGIQELHTTTAATLERDFKATYPYQYLQPSDGAGGLGVISRYPISGLQPLPNNETGVYVDVNGRQVLVVNVHIHFSGISRVRSERFFGLPYLRMYDMNGRRVQVESLRDALAPFGGPVIVLGDFNTGDREPAYALMREQYQDVFRATSTGFGFTFPYQRRMGPLYIPLPLVRIDYIWARGPLTPRSSSVACVQGTDHCMVVADLRLAADS